MRRPRFIGARPFCNAPLTGAFPANPARYSRPRQNWGNAGMFRGWQFIVWAMTLSLLSTEAPAVKPHGVSPANNPGDWVTPDDYPPDALRSNQSGVSAFTVDIDATGAPTRCKITSSSGSASLDEAACRDIVARARFTPAADRKGHAIASSYSSAVRWSIPQDDDAQPAAVPGCSMQNDEAIRVSGFQPVRTSPRTHPPTLKEASR
jgi:TonB family protein